MFQALRRPPFRKSTSFFCMCCVFASIGHSLRSRGRANRWLIDWTEYPEENFLLPEQPHWERPQLHPLSRATCSEALASAARRQKSSARCCTLSVIPTSTPHGCGLGATAATKHSI